jgi:folate-binding protein YgfZ
MTGEAIRTETGAGEASGAATTAGETRRPDEASRAPALCGDALAEYEAVRGREGCGLIDLSARGRVEVSGAEAVQFLNGMVTNDVAALGEGHWFEAAFPNPQGRLVALARVFRRGDSFLFDTEEATRAVMFRHLERFTLAGDFRVRDLTEETALFSVQGARAGEVVRGVLGDAAARTERGRVTRADFGDAAVTVARATHTAEDGFDLFADAGERGALWAAFREAGARPVGAETLEVLRVEAGLPRYGVDATEQNVVLEVVDEEAAVSYTKGCYSGQEIIARIHWRGHVAKKLTGLVLGEGADGAEAGARLRDAGGEREVGRVTSLVHSPRLDRRVALALVKYDFLEPGTPLRVYVGEEETCGAEVAALPLVRGSWYAVAAEAGGEVRA